MRYARIVHELGLQPWAIMDQTFDNMRAVLLERASGGRPSAEEIAVRIGGPERKRDPEPFALLVAEGREGNAVLLPEMIHGESFAADVPAAVVKAAERNGGERPKVVAVLPLFGIVSKRVATMEGISGPGGTSVERFMAQFRAAVASPDVSAILIQIDSPGGGVYGIEEAAAEIFAAREAKPILAIADALAASAAYWIASAAAELWVTPSGEVGSIGVYLGHIDQSAQDEMVGLRFTYISAGKFKTEANPHEPLDAEAKGALQARVDGYYGDFLKGVAKGRNVKASDVRNGFGQGRVVRAADAVKEGMADKVGAFPDAVIRAAQLGKRAARQDAAGRAEAAGAMSAAMRDTILAGL